MRFYWVSERSERRREEARGLRSVAVVYRGRVANCRIKSKNHREDDAGFAWFEALSSERRFWEG